jgi:hypothetical protein
MQYDTPEPFRDQLDHWVYIPKSDAKDYGKNLLEETSKVIIILGPHAFLGSSHQQCESQGEQV